MDIKLVEYALEVNKCGSINRAAEKLYMTQPALSRHIKELEQIVGFSIFSRTATGVLPTHQGSEFLFRSEKIFSEYQSFIELYKKNTSQSVFNLAISSVRYAVSSKAFINIYNKYKDCEYQNSCFNEENTQLVLEHIYDGLYSLGIILVSSEQKSYWYEKAKQYRLNWQEIYSEKTCLQVGENHPLAKRKSVSLKELENYPHATMAQNDVSNINPCASIRGYDRSKIKKRIVVNDRSMVYELLYKTDAYYIGVDLKNLALHNDKINYIPLEDSQEKISCIVLTLQEHVITPIETEYLNELKRLIGK